MTKPEGWKRDPARHVLAAKGVESGRTRRQAASHGTLALSLESGKSRVSGIDDSLKESCADQVIAYALSESDGDEKAARVLLESDEWLKAAVKDVAAEGCKGFLQRGSLEGELLRSFRQGVVVNQDSNNQEEGAGTQPRAMRRTQVVEKSGGTTHNQDEY